MTATTDRTALTAITIALAISLLACPRTPPATDDGASAHPPVLLWSGASAEVTRAPARFWLLSPRSGGDIAIHLTGSFGRLELTRLVDVGVNLHEVHLNARPLPPGAYQLVATTEEGMSTYLDVRVVGTTQRDEEYQEALASLEELGPDGLWRRWDEIDREGSAVAEEDLEVPPDERDFDDLTPRETLPDAVCECASMRIRAEPDSATPFCLPPLDRDEWGCVDVTTNLDCPEGQVTVLCPLGPFSHIWRLRDERAALDSMGFGFEVDVRVSEGSASSCEEGQLVQNTSTFQEGTLNPTTAKPEPRPGGVIDGSATLRRQDGSEFRFEYFASDGDRRPVPEYDAHRNGALLFAADGYSEPNRGYLKRYSADNDHIYWWDGPGVTVSAWGAHEILSSDRRFVSYVSGDTADCWCMFNVFYDWMRVADSDEPFVQNGGISIIDGANCVAGPGVVDLR